MFKRLNYDEVVALADDLNLSISLDEAEVLTSSLLEAIGDFERLDSLPIDDGAPVAMTKVVRDPGRRPSEDEDPLHAFITKCDVIGSDSGPLHGLRFGLKDNISVGGVQMTLGVQFLKGYVPDFDATIVTRILDAGARIVGKMNMDGFSFGGYGWGGIGDFGRTLHPCDSAYLTGGSSQGSVVAVASGDLDVGFGGDQGGSIRLPAAWCGVVGLKATHGLIPHTGVFGVEPTIDYTGPIARTTRDVARTLDVVAGRDAFDPRQRDVPYELPSYTDTLSKGVDSVRIGILAEGFGFERGERDVDELVREAVSVLERDGASVRQVSVPLHENATLPIIPLWSEGLRLMFDTNFGGAFANSYYPTSVMNMIGRSRNANGHELPLNIKRSLIIGEYLHRYYHGRLYARAQNIRRAFIAAYDEAFTKVDVIAMPTTSLTVKRFHAPASFREAVEQTLFGGAAPDLGAIIRNTVPFNYTGHPAISVPCGSVGGMPVGLQLVGPRFRDDVVLQVAAAYEHATARSDDAHHQPAGDVSR